MMERIGNGYFVVGYPGDGLLLTEHATYGKQVWSLSKLTRRHKGDPCAACNMPVGTHAYRPVGNPGNRMKRLCERHGASDPCPSSPPTSVPSESSVVEN